ncbi:MAG: type II toxin-antitoxin system VapB family antitoxin [Spirosomaceae bacterium]|nr:type II toxin-antitoxin system VapB family antitoxin [Spirosomataceae bacterium]
MTTNIAIDPEKLAQIMDIEPFRSKRELIDKALEAYLRLLRQQQALSLKGSKIWQGDLDEMRLD